MITRLTSNVCRCPIWTQMVCVSSKCIGSDWARRKNPPYKDNTSYPAPSGQDLSFYFHFLTLTKTWKIHITVFKQVIFFELRMFWVLRHEAQFEQRVQGGNCVSGGHLALSTTIVINSSGRTTKSMKSGLEHVTLAIILVIFWSFGKCWRGSHQFS